MDKEKDFVGAEEVEALFTSVRLGVISAALAAAGLSYILVKFRHLPTNIGIGWTLCIAGCASGHLLLRHFYWRSSTRISRWRLWGRSFALISFLEGVAWGWASTALAKHDTLDAKFLVLLTTQAIAAGSVPAFGRYVPAFLALFVPTTTFYLSVSLFSDTDLERASGILMFIYIFGMIALCHSVNRQFRQILRLRLETAALVEELRAQKTLAENANRAKSAFLAAASHDLRQPIHALGLFVGALKATPMPSTALRLVEQIDSSTQAMDGLFAALLDISRLDAGVVEVRQSVFALDALLRRICADLEAEAVSKGLKFRCRTRRVYVSTDPILLERILRNVISNALRYTDKGKVLIGCRVRESSVAVQIWDTGRGIPADERERIFQEYYQLGNSERDRGKGLGLGLAIVRRLTQLLDIPIRVRSAVGRGSCFEIELSIASALPIPLTPNFEGTSLKTQDGRLIVVVDDEAPIRAGMSSLLTGWGHSVIVAESGAEALRMLVNLPRGPDLLICDLRLRDGELGTSVVEMLRTEFNELIPAILVTGETAPDRLAEAHASGMLLLHKPVSNGRLRAALSSLLIRRSLQQADP